MSSIEVGHYSNAAPWLGWVASSRWILFTHEDGSLVVFNGRSKTGAVTGPGVTIPAPKEDQGGEHIPPPPSPPPELKE